MKNIALLLGRRRATKTAGLATEPSRDYTPPVYEDFKLMPEGHLVVAGGPGSGKTVILSAMAEVACRDMDVYVADVWLNQSEASAVRPSSVAAGGVNAARHRGSP